MVEDDFVTKKEEVKGKSSKLLFIILISVSTLLLVCVMLFFFMSKNNDGEQNGSKPVVEYVVPSKMYQLKDGSFLRLGFSVVVDADRIDVVQDYLENEVPGRLLDGINMLVGGKSRDDLISSSHNRLMFTNDLKNMMEEKIFAFFNKNKRIDKKIYVRDILISDFITQIG